MNNQHLKLLMIQLLNHKLLFLTIEKLHKLNIILFFSRKMSTSFNLNFRSGIIGVAMDKDNRLMGFVDGETNTVVKFDSSADTARVVHSRDQLKGTTKIVKMTFNAVPKAPVTVTLTDSAARQYNPLIIRKSLIYTGEQPNTVSYTGGDGTMITGFSVHVDERFGFVFQDFSYSALSVNEAKPMSPRETQMMIVAGVVAAIVVSAIIAYYFSHSMSNRAKVITDRDTGRSKGFESNRTFDVQEGKKGLNATNVKLL
jgi:hypothetical protein